MCSLSNPLVLTLLCIGTTTTMQQLCLSLSPPLFLFAYPFIFLGVATEVRTELCRYKCRHQCTPQQDPNPRSWLQPLWRRFAERTIKLTTRAAFCHGPGQNMRRRGDSVQELPEEWSKDTSYKMHTNSVFPWKPDTHGVGCQLTLLY